MTDHEVKINDFQYANAGYNDLEKQYLKEVDLSETLERKKSLSENGKKSSVLEKNTNRLLVF